MRIHLIFLVLFLSVFNSSAFVHNKKKLVAGGLLLAAKPISGVGALVGAGVIGKNVLGKITRRRSCITLACCTSSLLRKRRSLPSITNQVFNGISSRLQNVDKTLRLFGDTFHRGSDLARNASLTTRVVGLLAADRIRNGMTRILVRRKRAVPRRQQRPRVNLELPSGKMTLGEMLQFVKQNNAEVCLQRVICELRANNNKYGDAGIRFGAKLLNYENVPNREAEKYKQAQNVGMQLRNRSSQCKIRYPNCHHDPEQLIYVGNTILN